MAEEIPQQNPKPEPVTIFTIGHSQRSFAEFKDLLVAASITAVADIRRYPSSRRFPHFNQGALATQLAAAGISYHWFAELGGHRQGLPQRDSPNTLLGGSGLRGYADHMLTPAFQTEIHRLLALARQQRTTLMCAEQSYLRCHRQYLSDYLLTHQVAVIHLLAGDQQEDHVLTPGAKPGEGGGITYPGPPTLDI